jgi:hypothetical protein
MVDLPIRRRQMPEQLSLFRIRPRTVPQEPDHDPVVVEALTGPVREYLFGNEGASAHDRTPDCHTVLVWRIPPGARLVDPALITAFRTEHNAGRARLLVIAPIPTSTTTFEMALEIIPGVLLVKEEVDFAWRLERHWLVEWSDVPRPQRLPVIFESPAAVMVLGATIPPKMLPTLAALSAFPFITADELRAAAAFLDAEPTTAAELSRVLAYLEKFGLVTAATPGDIKRYWAARGRQDRRPLRVYANVLAPLVVSKRDESVTADWSSPYLLESGRLPRAEAAYLLESWRDTRRAFKARGLRTV